ncbi:hypothetical protein CASFOL_019663 [Castilleja foliolosa]|uniref:Uncharacterized protein n=1 Tax=Castilleja foliolosa TaxID=1961234 RepID=A0ABD3D0Q0_9LAMI
MASHCFSEGFEDREREIHREGEREKRVTETYGRSWPGGVFAGASRWGQRGSTGWRD